ncbi:MAG: SDR family oxidoreductase [Comamonadaceae bacterium]|nr:MAG: SDR family oxidoreductase [Comamonadaceae bacterium]
MLYTRIALVTGAARGTGAAIAAGLAKQGAVVAVTDLDGGGAQSVADDINAAGGQARAWTLDVTDVAQCRDVVGDICASLGDLSILVNNAGVRPRHAFDGNDRDDLWRLAMDVNVDGIRHMMLAALPALRRTRGSVINITSITASRASAQSIAYSTSKAAAQMLTQVMALELAADGIRVNAVAPGVIETPMTAPSREDPERRARLLSRIPMNRFGQPGEVVGPVVFLASDMASYMTGCVLAVDGGYLAT